MWNLTNRTASHNSTSFLHFNPLTERVVSILFAESDNIKMGLGSATWKVVRKYGPMTIIPTAVIALIYADWSHTREYKAKQREIKVGA